MYIHMQNRWEFWKSLLCSVHVREKNIDNNFMYIPVCVCVCSMVTEFQFYEIKRVLEMNGGDGGMTM